MAKKSWRRTLNLVIALSMLQAPFVPMAWAGNAPPPTKCAPVKACNSAIDDARTVDAENGLIAHASAEQHQQTLNGGAQLLGNRAAANATATCDAKAKCESQKKAFKIDNNTCFASDQKALDEAVDKVGAECSSAQSQVRDAGATQSASQSADAPSNSSNSSGGMSPMMAGLLGAALGAGAALLLSGNDKPDDEEAFEPGPGECPALQENGTIDCSLAGAETCGECNVNFEAKCASSYDTPSCQGFTSRYCSSEGVGSSYCKGATAWNYCKKEGRNMCPSCTQIAKNQSPACQSDPSLCVAQNSLAEIAAARTSCPTDPVFSDPAYTAGGGAQVPTEIANTGAVVVLPQSVGGMTTASASREGVAQTNGSQANYDTGSASYTVASVGGGREIASGQGAAAYNRAPASDVQGAYGPSLFVTGSEVIRKRCQTGKLNNCR